MWIFNTSIKDADIFLSDRKFKDINVYLKNM